MIRFYTCKVCEVKLWELHYYFRIGHTSIKRLLDIFCAKLTIGPGEGVSFNPQVNEAFLLNK